MKKLLIISVLSLGTLFQVEAQRERGKDWTPEKQAERMTERMNEKLALSEEQQKELYAIHLEQAQTRKAQMEARRKEMMQSRTSYQERLDAVLSPAQMQQWEEIRKENREKQREFRNSPQRRGPRGEGNERRGRRYPGNGEAES